MRIYWKMAIPIKVVVRMWARVIDLPFCPRRALVDLFVFLHFFPSLKG